ncbi:MAG TPA: esterase-like activity of phytase family protein [Verrucomicrobiae bacterium]|nr:esterase-like activity of phytase family protein [Verrucomicrobiae bacterium]
MKCVCFPGRSRCALATLLLLLVFTAGGYAQFTTPHLLNIPGDVTNTLGDTTIINHGLVGVGNISASALDGFGDTFGSISGLQITGWTNNGDGSYSGIFNILPDRGYNQGSFSSDYATRINQIGFTFTPYGGTTNIGGTTVAEQLAALNQVVFTTPISGVKLTYSDPITLTTSFTTGIDPGTNQATLLGQTLPYVRSYTGLRSPSSSSSSTYTINKLTIDSEALVLKPDGSGYFGDEYGPNIYCFDSARKIVGVIVPPPAFQPHSPVNVLNFNADNTPANGRRNNQGFEGVALSPDGVRLFALLQSSTVQDADSNSENRRQTRLLIYDVSSNATPASPIAEYALTLPTYRTSGNGNSVNSTCAQSEIVALDYHRLLVLSRDGNGLGNSSPNPNVFKSILLVDIDAGTPTNFVGDNSRNAEAGKITSSAGVLDPAITPLSWVEAINLLNTNQLAKFNIQYDNGTSQVTKLTMGEKWEGAALVPANDTNYPNDFFLFVGNDNDFMTSGGHIHGPDGSIVNYNGFSGYSASRIPAPVNSANNENDSRILVFRLTISTVLRLKIAAYPGAQAAITMSGGTIGQAYSILSTTNIGDPLLSWAPEVSVTQSVPGIIWVDTNSAIFSGQKFYNATGP